MKRTIFIRNIRARDQLELFIVSAVSSLLLLRFYLYCTGYPQVGGGSLHISHMLWGGLLMAAAVLCNIAFLGQGILRLTAFLGGVGFGIFIDEIGKFITKDNNYFFRPAVGIIYAIFVALYLVINFIGRRRSFTSREYQLNAFTQLEEAILLNLDTNEKAAAAQLLAKADPDSDITKQLKRFLHSVDTITADEPNVFERFVARVHAWYQRAWRNRSSNLLVRLFFILEIALFGLGIVLTVFNNFDNVRDFFAGRPSYGRTLVIGQLIATGIAALFAVMGVVRLAADRRQAFEYFRRATLTNLLLTEFFIFSRIQFGAIPSFLFNLVVLNLINFVIAQESHQPSPHG